MSLYLVECCSTIPHNSSTIPPSIPPQCLTMLQSRAGQGYGQHSASGAATDSTSTRHALRTLCSLLTATLGDPSTHPSGSDSPSSSTLPQLGPQSDTASSTAHSASPLPADALATLRALADAAKASDGSPTPTAPPPGSAAFVGHPGQLRVVRSAAWKAATAKQVGSMLPTVLLPLVDYPRPAVRGALATGMTVMQIPSRMSSYRSVWCMHIVCVWLLAVSMCLDNTQKMLAMIPPPFFKAGVYVG